MAGNDRVSEVLLRWEVDNAALKRVIDSNKRIEESLENVKGETAAAELTAKRLQVEFSQVNRMKSIDALARDFASVRLAGGNTVAEIERLTKALIDMGATESEIKQVVNQISRLGDEAERAKADVASDIGSNVSNNAPRRQGSRFTKYGNALFNLPDVGPSTTIARLLQGAGAAQEALDASAISYAKVAAVAAPVAIGVAAIAVAFMEFKRINDPLVTTMKGLISAQEQYFNVIANGTRDVVEEALNQAKNEQRAAQLLVDARKAIADNFKQQLDAQFAGSDVEGLGSIWAGIINGGGFNDLNAAAADAQKQLEESTFLINFFTGALDENATALADAKAKAAELTQELGTRFVQEANNAFDALTRLSDLAVKSRLNEAEAARQDFLLLQQIQDENSGQLQERIYALILESDSMRVAKAALEASGDATAKTTAQIQAYEAAILRNEAIYRIILGLLPGLVAAETALKKLNDAMNSLVSDGISKLAGGIREMRSFFDELKAGAERSHETSKRLGQAVDDLNEAQKKRVDAEKSLADAQANAARAINQAQQRINDAIRDGQQERARILADANTKSADLAYEYHIDTIDAAQDLADELKRIREDARFEELNAIGDRDALAAFLADQSADKEERTAQQQSQKEERRKQRDYQRALELLAQATQRELDIQRQRNEATIQAARQALDIERQKVALEISERQKALDIAVQQYRNFNQLLLDLARATQRQIIIPNTEFITPEEAKRRLAGGTYSSAAASIPQDSIAASTRSYAPQTAASAGSTGGMTIPITVNGIGMNRRQIIDAVDNRLNEYLYREGVQ